MRLAPYTDDDFWLTEALETDADVMRELGGPLAPDVLPDIHRRRVDDPWWFKIVDRGDVVGASRTSTRFPPVTNAPSNGLCRKARFSLVGQVEVDYAGRTLRCNHWKLDTSRPESSGAGGSGP